MKTKPHLLALACILTFMGTIREAGATHIVGNEITYKCTSTPGIFEVTLVLFRNCNEAPLCPENCGAACTQPLQLYGVDASCGSTLLGTISLSLVSVRDANAHVNSSCPGTKNACTNMGCVTPGFYTPAIERYEFVGFANIGPTSGIPASCCNVRLTYSLCCRSSDIATGAANANFYNDAVINRCHSISPCNSSPVANDPIMVICAGENAVLNTGAVDPDLDSLSYRFAPALSGYGSPIPYTPPFAYDRPMPWTGAPGGQFPAGIHCDPQNGDIRFTPPNASGTFTGLVVVEIKQWKKINGVMTVIGITRRDFQMMIRPDCLPNNPPRLITSPSQANFNIPVTDWEICAGEQFCFTVTAVDTDFNPPTVSDTSYLSWNGALAPFGATFLPDYDPTKRTLHDSLGGGPREDRFRFCWTPTVNMIRSTPYYFSVQGRDKRCPVPGIVTRAFSIKVSPKPSISIQRNIDSCGRLHVSFTDPGITIGSYLWDISPVNNPQQHDYYENQNPAIHPIRDTGMYVIKLVLMPSSTHAFMCSGLDIDSVRATRTSLIDSIVTGNPTCDYSQNGYISIYGINGVHPYQYALNQSPYSSNHSFTSLPEGSYTVRIKDAGGCMIEREVTLSGNNLLEHIEGYDKVNPGDSLLYIGRFKDGAKASWTVYNGTIVGSRPDSSYIFVKWGQKGLGSIRLVVSDSNCSDTSIFDVTIGNVGLAEVKNPMGILLFPNPTRSLLTISASFVIPETNICIYNILGKLLVEQPLNTQQELNLDVLPPGLYIVRVGDWNARLVKE